MTYLAFLVHRISQQRTHGLVLLSAVAFVFVQPLLVSAKPSTRCERYWLKLAQITPSPQDEATDEPSEDLTQIVEDPTVEAPAVDQPNPEQPTSETSNVLTLEIPTDEIPGDNTTYSVPFFWQGDTTITAQELANVAPPLQAEVSQGGFQIGFVTAETGDVLRILPDPAAGDLGSIRVGIKLDPNSTNPPFPAGQTVLRRISARTYAPEATTRLVVADDNGSSTIVLEGLNWRDYQVTRQIAADTNSLDVMLDGVMCQPTVGWNCVASA